MKRRVRLATTSLALLALIALARPAAGQCAYANDWSWYFNLSNQLTAATLNLYPSSWNGWQPCLLYVVSEPAPYNWQRVVFQQISGPAPVFGYAEAWRFQSPCHSIMNSTCPLFPIAPPPGIYVIQATVYLAPMGEGEQQVTSTATIRVMNGGGGLPGLSVWGATALLALLLSSAVVVLRSRLA